MDANEHKRKLAFEEFQLMYESTEKVTERRISNNRWNYSICSAVVVAISLILQWAISHVDFLAIGTLAAILLSFVGAFYCSLWVAQIRDFKNLNSAKFDVLNSMAPSIAFGPPKEDDRYSYSPFEVEWKILQEKDKKKEKD